MPERAIDQLREKAGEFLGGRNIEDEDGKTERKIEGYNTRINSPEEMRMFLLADFLSKQGVEQAEDFHDSLCKHGVSKQGEGRKELVQATQTTPNVSKITEDAGV